LFCHKYMIKSGLFKLSVGIIMIGTNIIVIFKYNIFYGGL